MKQEDKELLIKDLCARFPYCVKVLNSTFADTTIQTLLGRISEDTFVMHETYKEVSGDDFRMVRDGVNYTGHIDYIKPYLRPMPSMTDEEKKEFIRNAGYEVEESINGRHYEYYLKDFCGTEDNPYVNVDAIDWLNERHFDYRCLIEKGLALEAPKGMYNK